MTPPPAPACRTLRSIPLWAAFALALFGLTACGGSSESDATESGGDVPASPVDTSSVTRVLDTDDRFTTLATALDSTGLDSLLHHGGPFTVFAPTNAAFQALPEGTLDELLTDNQDRLRDVLAYHVVAGRHRSTDVVDGDTLTTLAGSGLPVSTADGAVLVGEVQLLAADVDAGNGVIHVLGAVLRPPVDD